MPPPLPPALASAYEVVSELGAGSYSTVVRARRRETGEEVAVKLIDKSRLVTHAEKLVPAREAEALRRVGRHENTVALLDADEDEERVALVLELAANGSLADVVREHPFGAPEPLARRVARELLRAVDHVHAKGHAHLDITPSNVLLGADLTVKLADFGLSRPLPGLASVPSARSLSLSLSSPDTPTETRLRRLGLGHGLGAAGDESSSSSSFASLPIRATASASSLSTPTAAAATATLATAASTPTPTSRVSFEDDSDEDLPAEMGTVAYAAPETRLGRPVTDKADAWSCGVVLHELVTGTTPVFAPGTSRAARRAGGAAAVEPTFPDALWGDKPVQALELCRALLVTDPAKRASCADALRFEWVRGDA